MKVHIQMTMADVRSVLTEHVRDTLGEGVSEGLKLDPSTFTTSKAHLLRGHTAVIWLKGISGCYKLDRVTPIIA